MRLNHKLIIELANAVPALDGPADAPFKFSSKTRYALAKNLRILKTRVEDVDKVRVKILQEVSPDAPIKKDSPEFEQFAKRWDEFLSQEDEIENLMRFTVAELNLDINPVPIRALAALGPIIMEEA